MTRLDAYVALKQNNDDLRERAEHAEAALAEMRASVDRITTEECLVLRCDNDALRADAERYRWLRDKGHATVDARDQMGPVACWLRPPDTVKILDGAFLDIAIDAALARGEEPC